MLPLEDLRSLEVYSMYAGVVVLALTECIFLEAAYDCAGPACRFECLFGILLMHVYGHSKTPM